MPSLGVYKNFAFRPKKRTAKGENAKVNLKSERRKAKDESPKKAKIGERRKTKGETRTPLAQTVPILFIYMNSFYNCEHNKKRLIFIKYIYFL